MPNPKKATLMKIEIKAQPGRREILMIYLDEEEWRKIHCSIFGRSPKFPCKSSMEEWEAAFQDMERKKVKLYVLRRLSAQSYHSVQLAKLLREKFVQPLTIQRIIEECQAYGYLNDEAWLENYMKAQLKRLSLRAALSKLQTKGFPREILDDMAEKWTDPQEEAKAIEKLFQTRYRHKNLSDFKERQKVFASLLRKGYSYEQVQKAYKKMLLPVFDQS
jgi:regulatory protein